LLFGGAPRRPHSTSEGPRRMEIMDLTCPSCRGSDWLPVGRGERRYLRCRECGQIRLLLVHPLPPTNAASIFMNLFPPADASVAQTEGGGGARDGTSCGFLGF
jgi:hypothetical protein